MNKCEIQVDGTEILLQHLAATLTDLQLRGILNPSLFLHLFSYLISLEHSEFTLPIVNTVCHLLFVL